MKNLFHRYWQIATIAMAIVILDQWTKELVRTHIPLSGSWLPESLAWLSPYARIVHWYNTGAAFGMFKQGSMVFTVLAFVVIGLILYYYPQVEKADWSLRIAMSMQLGGATGNLIDRLTIGHVTDFISIGKFPVFNVADASITVGAVVLFLGVWMMERAEKKQQSTGQDQPNESPKEATSE
ncbi:MAG: signal peptidase II [Anaerolineales bacterium]|nr:signal peptidase II [Anaerolineae bacterium]PWB73854.1 MAG: signal peptidase II [Anaerolineales bacterium]